MTISYSRTATLSVVVLCVLAVAQAFKPRAGTYYKLKTKSHGPTKCLEGNRFATTRTPATAAFMDRCNRVTGQMWKFVAVGNGKYRMKTKFLGRSKCFGGNRRVPSNSPRGWAFMDNCRDVSGQLWKIRRRSTKYFTLTTMFREPFGECLQGNRFFPSSTRRAAAFMSKCRPFPGQLFYAVRA